MMERLEESVGRRIRSLREAQDLSLRALAARSGLSINAISRIERGQSSPTVGSLQNLASALGVPIPALFDGGGAPAVVLVRRDQRMRSEGSGVVLESLASGLPGQHLDPYLMTLEPGANSFSKPVSHRGEEFLHCLQGNVACRVADESHSLTPGDSFLFQANQPHLYRNEGQGFATVLLMLERQPDGPPVRGFHLDF